MKLYFNNSRENASNTYYSNSLEIRNTEDLYKVVSHDHVGAQYTNNYRKNENFICSDCSMFDVDNDNTDDSNKWITPNTIREAFPDVSFYVSYSRNHMKSKNGKLPRPKFHIYFPDVLFTDMETYKSHKEKVCEYFPAFDQNAKDVARFFFGVAQPQVEYFNGNLLLYNFMESVTLPTSTTNVTNLSNIIPEGMRNSTLHKFALSKLTRYGDTSNKAFKLYIEESKKCLPPLCEKELNTIWQGALKYYNDTIKTSPTYNAPKSDSRFKPKEFTDIGQADMFSQLHKSRVLYSHATNYLYYNGQVWLEDDLMVHSLAQQLTRDQVKEARLELKKAQAEEDLATVSGDDDKISKAKLEIKLATDYRKFALGRQNYHRIFANLKEAEPMLSVNTKLLDNNCFLLNTPTGTIDLRTKELLPHSSKNYCTKITATGPSDDGTDLLKDFLNVITCNDKDLEEYLQIIAGMIAVGKVFCENLIIAYGCGKNGKSTFFNLIAHVLGDYSGSLSSESLTANCRKNKSPEYAELRGKRLAIASELEDGMRLNTAIVKKLCSTDPIYAEKKYQAPFSFIPSHTVVLYTNHLPSVTALDAGTWRRLIVIPFNAVIKEQSDRKNYAEYLFNTAGGAVMKWIVEGAYKFISSDYKIEQPEAVKQAIQTYREENDWISCYISERCEINSNYKQGSGALYEDYRIFSEKLGESASRKDAFNNALKEKGFKIKRTSKGSFVHGLRLKSSMIEYENSLLPAYTPITVYDDEIQELPDYTIEF